MPFFCFGVKSNVILCHCECFFSPLPQALDNVPVLLYILALKTLLLCLAFAGVKIYQSKKEEEALKKKQQEKRRLAQQTQELLDNPKEDWELVLSHVEVRYAAFISSKKHTVFIINMINFWTKDPYFNTVFFSPKETQRKRAMSQRESQTSGNHFKQWLRMVLFAVKMCVFFPGQRLFVAMELLWQAVCIFHLWPFYFASSLFSRSS